MTPADLDRTASDDADRNAVRVRAVVTTAPSEPLVLGRATDDVPLFPGDLVLCTDAGRGGVYMVMPGWRLCETPIPLASDVLVKVLDGLLYARSYWYIVGGIPLRTALLWPETDPGDA